MRMATTCLLSSKSAIRYMTSALVACLRDLSSLFSNGPALSIPLNQCGLHLDVVFEAQDSLDSNHAANIVTIPASSTTSFSLRDVA